MTFRVADRSPATAFEVGPFYTGMQPDLQAGSTIEEARAVSLTERRRIESACSILGDCQIVDDRELRVHVPASSTMATGAPEQSAPSGPAPDGSARQKQVEAEQADRAPLPLANARSTTEKISKIGGLTAEGAWEELKAHPVKTAAIAVVGTVAGATVAATAPVWATAALAGGAIAYTGYQIYDKGGSVISAAQTVWSGTNEKSADYKAAEETLKRQLGSATLDIAMGALPGGAAAKITRKVEQAIAAHAAKAAEKTAGDLVERVIAETVEKAPMTTPATETAAKTATASGASAAGVSETAVEAAGTQFTESDLMALLSKHMKDKTRAPEKSGSGGPPLPEHGPLDATIDFVPKNRALELVDRAAGSKVRLMPDGTAEIIGASAEPEKLSYRLMSRFLLEGSEGEVRGYLLYKPSENPADTFASMRWFEHATDDNSVKVLKFWEWNERAQGPEWAKALATIPEGSVPTGVGTDRMGWLAPDGTVRVLGPKYNRPDCPALMQPLAPPEVIGNWQIEKFPYAETRDITREEIEAVMQKMKSQGWTTDDLQTGNVGRLADGSLVQIDPEVQRIKRR